MTKYTGITEFMHLNPNKNIKAQRDVGGYGWSLAGEKKILQSTKVNDTRTRLSFLSCTCQGTVLALACSLCFGVIFSPLTHKEVKF